MTLYTIYIHIWSIEEEVFGRYWGLGSFPHFPSSQPIMHQFMVVSHCVLVVMLFFALCVDINRNVWGQKSSNSLMERKAHYDSILDRSKRITWQDDCYVDLQSTSCSLSSQAETEGKSFIMSLMHCWLWSGSRTDTEKLKKTTITVPNSRGGMRG